MALKATNLAPVDGANVIDLDARRAARMEKTGGTKSVKHGGKTWQFKNELPMQTVENFSAGDISGAFKRLLVDPGDAEAFLEAADLSQNDFAELMRLVYGLDLPNASPSTGS